MSLFETLENMEKFKKLISSAPEEEKEIIKNVVKNFTDKMEKEFIDKFKVLIASDEFQKNGKQILEQAQEKLRKT